jgi:predicted TIM-barrel fold metal-dependent hydrolase
VAEVKRHRDRLIPFAVINPFYVGWPDDLKTCHEEFGMGGLRLYPKWHHYSLSDRCCLDLVNAAAERGMVISIPLRAEDQRQRSWLVDVPDVPLEEIVSLVKACPQAQFILVNGLGFVHSPLGRQDNGLPSNYFIEVSRLSAVLANEIGQLIANLGAERVVFGTGMPFNYPDPALVKLEVLEASEEDKEKIRWRNAATLLGAEV